MIYKRARLIPAVFMISFGTTVAHLADYIIYERIQKHIMLLEQCINNRKEIQVITSYNECPSQGGYSHELVRLCLKQIAQEGSLCPVFKIWDQFKNTFSGSEADQLFLDEISIILYAMYTHCFESIAHTDSHQMTATDFTLFCDKVVLLSLNDRLNVLDSLYEALDDYVTQPHFISTSLTWAIEHLLQSPIVLIALGSVAYFFLKNHSTRVIGVM